MKLVDICVVPYSKIHRYSPTEQEKVWDKPLNRKAKMTVNPSQAMDLVREGTQDLPQNDDTKTIKLIQGYLDVHFVSVLFE